MEEFLKKKMEEGRTKLDLLIKSSILKKELYGQSPSEIIYSFQPCAYNFIRKIFLPLPRDAREGATDKRVESSGRATALISFRRSLKFARATPRRREARGKEKIDIQIRQRARS